MDRKCSAEISYMACESFENRLNEISKELSKIVEMHNLFTSALKNVKDTCKERHISTDDLFFELQTDNQLILELQETLLSVKRNIDFNTTIVVKLFDDIEHLMADIKSHLESNKEYQKRPAFDFIQAEEARQKLYKYSKVWCKPAQKRFISFSAEIKSWRIAESIRCIFSEGE